MVYRKGLILGAFMALGGAAVAQVDTSAPKTIWDADLDGTAIHLESGLVCPNSLKNDFRRDQLAAYDKTGFDVSCNYKSVQTGDDITVYLTRRDPALLPKVFDSAKQAVLSHTPSAKLRDDVLPAPPSAELKWFQAGFSENDGKVASDLFLASLAGWEYEIRATYKAADAASVAETIADIDNRLMASAGAHLKACAAAPVAGRAGQPLHTPQMFQALVISGAVRVTAMKSDLEKGADWCAQTSLTIGGNPFMDWRNIAPDASVVERLTGATGAPRAYAFKDPVAAELAAKADPASVPADGGFVVVIDNADGIEVMDIYAGYPPLMDVAKILAGGHQILARVDKTSKNITVNSSAFHPQ